MGTKVPSPTSLIGKEEDQSSSKYRYIYENTNGNKGQEQEVIEGYKILKHPKEEQPKTNTNIIRRKQEDAATIAMEENFENVTPSLSPSSFSCTMFQLEFTNMLMKFLKKKRQFVERGQEEIFLDKSKKISANTAIPKPPNHHNCSNQK